MTCIAYRAGIMACDSAWSGDGTLLTRRSKIVRLKSGALIGEAGDDDTRHIWDLFKDAKKPEQLPTREALLKCVIDYSAILVLPIGRVYAINLNEPAEDQNHWTGGIFEVAEGYYSVGSGAAHALTALDCGKTAREAVELACRRDMQCRPPVHTVPLVRPKPTPKVKDAKRKA